ncbi:hypothetical protein MN116_002977 [Schistosoma mekongi]|uniref:Dendritic cell-specific transmembrane protein-like domain-containing protein n=1 Tax=Schistosoma mekongi TaxID=38744 RepID=A0AAE1ZGW5_SCHME|nr:hypothetical protein MN116_002977 [Schistosoma mekongi]
MERIMTTLKSCLINKDEIEWDRITLQPNQVSVLSKPGYKCESSRCTCSFNVMNELKQKYACDVTYFNQSDLSSMKPAKIECNDYSNQRKYNEYIELIDLRKQRLLNLIKMLEKPSIFCTPFYYSIKVGSNICNKISIVLKYKKWNFGKLFNNTNHGLSQMIRNNLFGLIIGILVGFSVNILFITRLFNNLYISTLLSAYIMMFSIFAFSSNFRCIALLTFPYLTTSHIRWLLLLYAAYLSIYELSSNIFYNLKAFSDLFDCIMSEINRNMFTLNLHDSIFLSELKVSSESFVRELNSMQYNIRMILSNIHLSIFKLITVIENNIAWIESMLTSCRNTDVLSNLCQQFFNKAYLICITELNVNDATCEYLKFNANTLCTSIQVSTNACDIHKQFMENSLSFISKDVLNDKMERILNIIGRDNITLVINSDEFNQVNSNVIDNITDLFLKQSNSYLNQIERMKFSITWILFLLTMYTMIHMIIRILIFRNTWLNNITYDNNFLTVPYIKQEKLAIIQDLPSTFPLTQHEWKHYKMLSSFSWTQNEKNKMKNSGILHIKCMVLIIAIMLINHMIHISLPSLSYSHNVTHSRSRYLRNDDYSDPDSVLSNEILHQTIITGGIFFTKIMKNIIDLFIQIRNIKINNDATVCRPIQNSQDINNYTIIITLIILSIISQLTQVYAMRLRHAIMIRCYPEKSNQRASLLREYLKNNHEHFDCLRHTSRRNNDKPDWCLENQSKTEKISQALSIKYAIRSGCCE